MASWEATRGALRLLSSAPNLLPAATPGEAAGTLLSLKTLQK